MSIVIDEYEVINSNDKVERTDYGQETDDDDDTSDAFIRALFLKTIMTLRRIFNKWPKIEAYLLES